MGTNTPNLECRMYEAKYPEVDTPVMIKVKSIGEEGAYVSLLEYDNLEGMIMMSELSRRRIRSVTSLIKVGCVEPVMVVRVDEDKGYVDLSKRRVSEEDIQACEERYSKSKLVHSILRHVAETLSIDLEELYVRIGWPLHRKYGHAYAAFKVIVSDPDSILDSLTCEVKEIGPDGQEVTRVVPAVSDEIKDALVRNIRRRMSPQPCKMRANVEMICYQFDGVKHIKNAMRMAMAAGNQDCPVTMKVIAVPVYTLTTQHLDEAKGLSILEEAIEACKREIEKNNGMLVVKEAPRVVSDKELDDQFSKVKDNNEEDNDKELLDQIKKMEDDNEEHNEEEEEDEDDNDEEEDTGKGDS